MKLLKKLLKWVAISLASLVALIVLLAVVSPNSDSKAVKQPTVEQVEEAPVQTGPREVKFGSEEDIQLAAEVQKWCADGINEYKHQLKLLADGYTTQAEVDYWRDASTGCVTRWYENKNIKVVY